MIYNMIYNLTNGGGYRLSMLGGSGVPDKTGFLSTD